MCLLAGIHIMHTLAIFFQACFVKNQVPRSNQQLTVIQNHISISNRVVLFHTVTFLGKMVKFANRYKGSNDFI